MKKAFLFFAAVTTMAFVSCQKDPQDTPKDPSNLTQFGFLASENAVLMGDVIVENPENNIALEFPIGVGTDDLKALVPFIAVDSDDVVITINGEEVAPDVVPVPEDPETKAVAPTKKTFDFSEDVDIMIKRGKVTHLYTVRVSPKTAPNFVIVAKDMADSSTAAHVMAINPVTGEPVVAAYLTSNDGQKPFAIKFNGSDFTPVVGTKNTFLEHRVGQMGISFDNDGVLYASFRDYKKGTTAALARTSIVRLDGSEAKYVGDTASIVYPRSNPAVFGDGSNLFVAYACGAADNGVAARALELAKWSGSEWTVAQSINGRNASDYAYYTKNVYGKDGKNYLFIYNQNVHTYSLYQYTGDGFSTVFEGLAPLRADGTSVATMTNLRDCECAVATDGTPYVLTGSRFIDDTYIAGLIKVTLNEDGTTSQTIIGGPMPERNIDKDYTDNWSIDLDANGVPYFAYADENDNLYVTWIDAKTRSWATPAQLGQKFENPTIAFSKDGSAFVSAVSTKGNASIPSGRIVLFQAK